MLWIHSFLSQSQGKWTQLAQLFNNGEKEDLYVFQGYLCEVNETGSVRIWTLSADSTSRAENRYPRVASM